MPPFEIVFIGIEHPIKIHGISICNSPNDIMFYDGDPNDWFNSKYDHAITALNEIEKLNDAEGNVSTKF